MNIKLSETERAFLMKYAEVYDEEREFDGTADPVVLVQDIERIPAEIGYEDGIEYYDARCSESYDSLNELLEEHKAEYNLSDEEVEEMEESIQYLGEFKSGEPHNVEIKRVGYKKRWKTVAYFLTRHEANLYLKYQGHNLHSPRVYTAYAGYDNRGEIPCIIKLLKRMGETLLEENIYSNVDRKCECYLCELKETCAYANKYQRHPADLAGGALGLCPKLRSKR